MSLTILPLDSRSYKAHKKIAELRVLLSLIEADNTMAFLREILRKELACLVREERLAKEDEATTKHAVMHNAMVEKARLEALGIGKSVNRDWLEKLLDELSKIKISVREIDTDHGKVQEVSMALPESLDQYHAEAAHCAMEKAFVVAQSQVAETTVVTSQPQAKLQAAQHDTRLCLYHASTGYRSYSFNRNELQQAHGQEHYHHHYRMRQPVIDVLTILLMRQLLMTLNHQHHHRAGLFQY